MSGLHRRDFPGDPRRPALALHCMMGNGGAWGVIAEHLGGRVAVTALDLPGHGLSPAWEAEAGAFSQITLEAARETLASLAETSADGRVDLLGHSFGGVAAMALALDQPAQIRSLSLIEPVLFAAAPPERRDPDRLLDQLEALEAAGDRSAATATFLRYWNGPDVALLPKSTRAQLDRQMSAVMDTMGAVYRDEMHILRPGALDGLTVPIGLIRGEHSAPEIAVILDALEGRMPNATISVIAGGNHMAPLNQPVPTAAAIAANLDRA